jgi:alkylhydroperoxidase family enzyme
MKPRMEYWKVTPGAFKAMSSLETYLRESGLDKSLLHMVKLPRLPDQRLRLLHRHALEGRPRRRRKRAAPLRPGRLARSPYYTDRERAALEWTEALTNITDGHVPDAVYDAVRGHFSEKELADLTWAVAAINAWNRVSIAFRSEAGTYKAVTRG